METLIGASITVVGEGKGVNSNQYGFYSITLPEGNYRIICSYVGYLPTETEIELRSSIAFNFSIFPKSTLSQEIVISSRRRDANVKNAQMGKIDLSMNRIR